MKQRAQELRQAIERHRGDKRRWRCPEELRLEVVAYAHEQSRGGKTQVQVAAEVGVSETSLQRWVAADRVGSGEPASLRTVKVIDPLSSKRALTLVTPHGYRIEGLDVENAARLLQAL